MTVTAPGERAPAATLHQIERRVLWLATRMIDHANRERIAPESPDPDRPGEFALKVGGHQASCASMVGIMTSLWFGHLSGDDKVAVKPHASPVFHAIKYLTGDLDRVHLIRLREFGGLQAYPSRTKDPDVADFSTGSVGLGAVAPLFAAATRRYVNAHFPPAPGGPSPRFVALVGDAELDEGNIWEAIADPALQGLGNVMWVVDVNRQSLDRVIPGMKIHKLRRMFEESGWHVVEAKYGHLLRQHFARDGGDALRRCIDDMSNEEYQSLFAHRGASLRERLFGSAPAEMGGLLADVADDDLAELVQNLGGHDIPTLLDAYRACDEVADRPSVVFAYTVKGWGLPIAGDPLNHAAMLSGAQIDELRAQLGLAIEQEWDRFDESSPEGRLCGSVGPRLAEPDRSHRPRVTVPPETGVIVGRPVSTQETFGRILTALGNVPAVAERLVTASPDVSVSTNLGGWINKMGVFAPEPQPDFLGEDRLLRWKQGPVGRHVELGISEMNLFLLLHALGLGYELHGETLLPVGTVYDPFVCRGLDALIYALYNGARFVVVGTPSGVTLAPEGGAHQSTITASIGMELPGITLVEPAYAPALDWLLCDGLDRLTRPDGDSTYLRLSTRTIDQTPFLEARERLGVEALRSDVLAGAYRLVEPPDGRDAEIVIAAAGAVVPEAVQAARLLASEGVPATVVELTSADRVYRDWRNGLRDAARAARPAGRDHHLARVIRPSERRLPIVTVHDAASHALAFLGSVFGARTVPVGVDDFGQSGTIGDLYGHFDLLPQQLVNAALVAIG